jgi:hypothetical protein
MSTKFARAAWEELAELGGALPEARARRLTRLFRRVMQSRELALRRLRADPELWTAMPAGVVAEVRREAVERWGGEVAELEHRRQETDGALECVRQYTFACARGGALSRELEDAGLSGEGPAAAGVCGVVNELLVRPRVAAEPPGGSGAERGLRLAGRMLAARSRRLAAENRRLTEENLWLAGA